MSTTILELKDLLCGLPPGNIPDEMRATIIGQLGNCWNEFSGSRETKMEAHKLSRAEDLAWRPPSLYFKVARHGGTELGSTREQIQHWQVNLEEKIAYQATRGFRQLIPMAQRLTNAKLNTIAMRVTEAIQAGAAENSDIPLDWITEAEFRIVPSSLIPADGFKQTLVGRRKRMKVILLRHIQAIGWVPAAQRGRWLKFRKCASS
jgi:hypothetical protein